MKSRDALGRGVKEARRSYKKDGLYDQKTREALQKVIKENKKKFPDIFDTAKQ